jgi:hypothetical protein
MVNRRTGAARLSPVISHTNERTSASCRALIACKRLDHRTTSGRSHAAGDGTFCEAVRTSIPALYGASVVGYFNGDEKADVLLYSPSQLSPNPNSAPLAYFLEPAMPVSRRARLPRSFVCTASFWLSISTETAFPTLRTIRNQACRQVSTRRV